jgi:hypothetical protein
MTKHLQAVSLCVSVALQYSLHANVASAQDYPLPASVIANLQPEFQPNARSEAQQFANPIYHRLLLKLDEMDRLCELSEAQRAKLNVAAKGAVDHVLDHWLASNADRLRAGGGNIVAAQANVQQVQQAVRNQLQAQIAEIEALNRQAQLAQRAAARQPAPEALKAALPERDREGLNAQEALAQQQKALRERQEALKLQIAQLEQNAVGIQVQQVADPFGVQVQQLGGRVGGLVIGGAVRGNVAVADPTTNAANDPTLDAEKVKIWTAAVDFTLSEEQKTRLTAAAAERSSAQPMTNAERVLNEIDRQLLLDRAQREKLSPLVLQAVSRPSVEGQLNRDPVPQVAINVLRVLPSELVNSILSERQRAQHQRLITPRAATPATQTRIMVEGDVLFVPAPAPVPVVR